MSLRSSLCHSRAGGNPGENDEKEPDSCLHGNDGTGREGFPFNIRCSMFNVHLFLYLSDHNPHPRKMVLTIFPKDGSRFYPDKRQGAGGAV